NAPAGPPPPGGPGGGLRGERGGDGGPAGPPGPEPPPPRPGAGGGQRGPPLQHRGGHRPGTLPPGAAELTNGKNVVWYRENLSTPGSTGGIIMAKNRKWGPVLAFGAVTAVLGGIAAYKHRKEIERTLQ